MILKMLEIIFENNLDRNLGIQLQKQAIPIVNYQLEIMIIYDINKNILAWLEKWP